LVSADVDFW
jgi:hypothetical protein